MTDLLPLAETVALLLKERRQTVAIAESSAGGLISATLLAQPGASAYFIGGAVVYTYLARGVFLNLPDAALVGLRPATEPYALLLAQTVRRDLGATWGLAETGATGPTANRYGDPAGTRLPRGFRPRRAGDHAGNRAGRPPGKHASICRRGPRPLGATVPVRVISALTLADDRR